MKKWKIILIYVCICVYVTVPVRLPVYYKRALYIACVVRVHHSNRRMLTDRRSHEPYERMAVLAQVCVWRNACDVLIIT